MAQDEAELRRLARKNVDEGIEAFEHANNGLLAVSYAVSCHASQVATKCTSSNAMFSGSSLHAVGFCTKILQTNFANAHLAQSVNNICGRGPLNKAG